MAAGSLKACASATIPLAVLAETFRAAEISDAATDAASGPESRSFSDAHARMSAVIVAARSAVRADSSLSRCRR